MENDILKQKLIGNGLPYTPVVIPDIVKGSLLILTHDKAGHNGFRITYLSLKNQILLERHEKVHPQTLHQMPSLCKT